MLEVLQIFSHFFLFLLLTYFPFNKFTVPKFAYIDLNSNYKVFIINIIFLLNVFLFLSFFKLNLNLPFIAIFLIDLFFFIFSFSNIIKEIFFKKNLFFKFAFIFICFCFFFRTAANLEIGWDGLAHWLPKANTFYNNKSFFETSHPQYPQLGGYIWAFFWKNSFMQKEYLGRLFLVYLYLMSIFIIASCLNFQSDFKRLIFIFCLIFFTYDYENKYSGYMDYLVFSLLTLCSKILSDVITASKKSQNHFDYILLIMSTILLPWVKNEGVFYSLFLGIVYLFITTQSIKNKITFISFVLINIFIQFFFLKIILPVNQTFQIPLTADIILKNIINIKELLYRVFYISFYLFRSFFQFPLVLINFISLFFCFKYYKTSNKKFFYVFFLLNLIFIYGIYISTPFPLIWHLQTSLSRLMLQSSGFYSFMVVYLVNRRVIKI
jgi:hypothetical protein